MTCKKQYQNSSDLRFRFLVILHLVWLVLAFLLGAWWSRLLWIQAVQIIKLETALGVGAQWTQNHWHRTQKMLYGESFFFLFLFLGCTGFLFSLYWRDVRRSRGIQAFFAGVTHELRTPLASIRLQAESIAAVLEKVNPVARHLQRLLQDSIRLENQVERTLELARLEGGAIVYLQSFQLKPWSESFLQSWWMAHQERSLQLEWFLEDQTIRADPVAMEVIFRNLLENAWQHNLEKDLKIQIKSLEVKKGSSAWVCLVCQDDGQGFSGDWKNLGKIFQKSSSSQGSGVGLYLVKMLMQKMGGRVEFGGSEGGGFQVMLFFKAV